MYMTVGQEKYLEVLRAALWAGLCGGSDSAARTDSTGNPTSASNEMNAPCAALDDEIRLLAKQQATAGLVCSTSDDPRCRQEMVRQIISHEKLNSALKGVTSLLNDNGINNVLLKGQGLASYYSQPMLRNCGDIDLYVGMKNYEKACRLLLDVAKKDAANDANAGKDAAVNDASNAPARDTANALSVSENNKHFTLSYHGVPVELHRVSAVPPTPLKAKIYRKYEASGLTRNLVPVEIDGRTVNTPEDTFNALYIFIHFFYHFLSFGIGLRQVCDWTMFLYKRGKFVDRAKLENMLDALGLMKPWKTFGVIAVDTLGLPAGEMPFYDPSYSRKAQKVLERIFVTGNFGKNKAWKKYSRASYFMKKTSSVYLHTVNAVATFLIFPKQATLAYISMLVEGFRQVFREKFNHPGKHGAAEEAEEATR